jgi:hypothetical protein
VRLLRTIQLDASDSSVLKRRQRPVSGRYLALSHSPVTSRRSRMAKHAAHFALAFLGLASLGRSTLVQIVHASEADRGSVVDILATQLVSHFGARMFTPARPAAEGEIDLAASLCVYPAGAVVAVTRRYEEGETRETFRALHPREGAAQHERAFEFLEIVGEDDTR